MSVLKRKTNNGWESVLLPALDQTPTQGSNRGVTSNGVYNAIQASGAVWGNITGTLSDQTDLQAVLDDKEDIEFNAAPTALTEALTNIVVGGKTYTSGGALPAGTAASQGLVWNGTEWLKQTGYGYVTEGSGQFDVSWDGDPTGKVVAMTNYVKVSDTLPTVQAGDTATCYMLDGNGGTYGPFTANVSVPSSSEDMLMIQWTLDTMTFQNYIVLRDTTLYEENISKGVYYFYHDGSGSSKYWCSRMVCAGSSSVTHQFDANLIPNKGAAFVTEAPTAANTDGIRVAYLTSEPATKYDGWLYLIKE